ncbi:MAG TPA: HepT-like ribonuclease domain-containing protein [Gemmatimonadaceae bacterium]|jgi:uncharacterized protein with HEPN domain|nr:HepT-like ribonuclease domain-containing protein [Gemmatimonadaceae bacterium]
MPSSRPRDRLEDLLDNIRQAESYLAGLTLEQFQEYRMAQDAVERCLARISEATVKLDHVMDTRYPTIPWARIRTLGNVLRHAYDQVDARTVWGMVVDDLPPLRAACEAEANALDAGMPFNR